MQDIRFNNDACIYLFDNRIYKIDVKVNGLLINMTIGISIQCFRQRPQQVRLYILYCDVECFDYNRQKPQRMYVSKLAR